MAEKLRRKGELENFRKKNNPGCGSGTQLIALRD
jgi:hypothetical protein